MSRYNIKVRELDSSELSWHFEVLTCDFSENGENQLVGILSIEKENKSIEFYPKGFWENKSIIPIRAFYIPEDEASRIFDSKEYESMYTGWVKRIYTRARLIITDKVSDGY